MDATPNVGPIEIVIILLLLLLPAPITVPLFLFGAFFGVGVFLASPF